MATKTKKENKMQPTALASMFNQTAGYEPTPVQAEEVEPKVQKTEKDYEHFNFICDKQQKKEIMAISKLTGFSIKEIMGRALSDFLTLYKEKNGEIDTKVSKSLDDML